MTEPHLREHMTDAAATVVPLLARVRPRFGRPVSEIPLRLRGSIIMDIFLDVQRTVMRSDEVHFVLQRSSTSRCSSAIDDSIKSTSMMISPSGFSETS